jgi:signal transduction histidine kinase
MTIQKKTTLLFTGITAGILSLTVVVAYFFMNIFAFNDFYKRLEIRGIISAKAQLEQHKEGMEEVYSRIREKHLEPLTSEKEYFLPAANLNSFIESKVLPDLPERFYNELKRAKTANWRSGSYFYTGLYYYDNGRPYIIILGAQNDESIVYTRNLRLILIACCLLGTIIAYWTGILFSKQTFRPIGRLIDGVKNIGIENLHLRLEERSGEDEIAELTATFNEMLSRLETAFETQNNFVSNASHEFRTPLTTIYGEAEIALSRPREAAEYVRSLEIIVSQSEKLQHLTDSLLNLAQTGFDGKKLIVQQIAIDELLLDVKYTINNIVPDNKVNIVFGAGIASGPDLTISGNYQLLKLGLSNVIENGCKYSDNDVVTVTLDIADGRLHITIVDKGIGIPVQELKYIYDPFFRASNTGRYRGYGIGLPLTRNIFRLHKGEINVLSNGKDGTSVTLIIPLV